MPLLRLVEIVAYSDGANGVTPMAHVAYHQTAPDHFGRAWLKAAEQRPLSAVLGTPDLLSIPIVDKALRVERYSPTGWDTFFGASPLLGLRQAAKQHGVSHETVRQIVRHVSAYAR